MKYMLSGRMASVLVLIGTGFMLALQLAGCGGSGPPRDLRTTQQGKLSPETTFLPAGGNKVVKQTSNSMTLDGTGFNLKPGSIILSTEGRGALRKVSSVSTSGGKTVVQTEDATLTEAFDELHVKAKPGFNRNAIGDITSSVPGLTFKWVQGTNAVSRQLEYNTLELDFGHLQLHQGRALELDGKAYFRSDPEFDIEVNRKPGDLLPSVASMRIAYNCTFEGELTLTSKYGGGLGLKQTWFDDYVGQPIVAGWLIFLPRLKVESEAIGSAAGKIENVHRIVLSASASESFVRDAGWTTLKSLSPTMTASISKAGNSFQVDIVPVKVTFAIELYGIAGPYVDLGHYLSGTGTHTVQNSVEGIDALISAQCGGSVGVVAETPAKLSRFFGASWTPFDYAFTTSKTELFHQFFPFSGEASLLVGDNGPAPDDIFQAAIDGDIIGQTDRGGTGGFRIGDLSPGAHILRITCLDDGDNGNDIGTLGLSLANGYTFTDGSSTYSDDLAMNESRNYTIIAPVMPSRSPWKPLPKSRVKTEKGSATGWWEGR